MDYLRQLWEYQKGTCPYTGWELMLPDNSNGWRDGNNPKSASLDRIDNSKGYIQGNVRFVAVIVNYARNGFSESSVFEFARAVVKQHGT